MKIMIHYPQKRQAMLTFGKAFPGEKERIFSLCASCLGTSSVYFAVRDARDPTLLRNERLVARDGVRLVSNVTLFSFRLSFGKAAVHAGGIADVATDPRYRGQGSATSLLESAHQFMQQKGYPLALLGTGIHKFYERLGYEIWEAPWTRFLSPKAPAVMPSVRRLDPDQDLAVLSKLNQAARAEAVGPLVRSNELWTAQPHWSPVFPGEDLNLALISRGDRAFMRVAFPAGQQHATVLEFAAQPGDQRAAIGLAAVLIRSVLSRGANAIWIPDACRDLWNILAKHSATHEPLPNRHLMVKILSLSGLLKELQPELEERARQVSLSAGAVCLKYADQSAALLLRNGKIDVLEQEKAAELPYARLEPARWLEVFMGARLFSMQAFAQQSRLGEKEINFLDALFPRRDSLFWEADSF